MLSNRSYRIKSLLLLLSILIISGCESSILDDPSVAIIFSIPESGHVKLTVENSYDTIVATLIDKPLEVGMYKVNFEGVDLAEGIYFYTIEIKGNRSMYYSKSTRYLILVK